MELKFENEFKICTFVLHLFGAHPNTVRNKKWIAKFIYFTTISCASLFLLFNTVINHDIPNGEYTEAVKNASIALISILISYKYYILTRNRDSLMNLINVIDEDYSSFDKYSPDEKLIVLDYCKREKRIFKYWIFAMISTGAVFPVKAFFLMFYYYSKGEFELIPMFDLAYPEIINRYKEVTFVYFLLFIFCFTFDFNACCMYIGFDPLVFIFLLHVCGQLDILNKRIQNVMIEVEDVNEIRRKLKEICQKQQALYSFLISVQSNFITLFEIIMKSTTFIAPFSMFQIVQSLHRLEFNIEFMLFFMAGMMNFLMPCYYSNLLMDKGESMRQAIYNCNWESQPDIGIRKTILLMLTRCSKPISMRTIFYDVNLETYALMCRQSYAIFNALNTIGS